MNTFNELLVHITAMWLLGHIDSDDRYLISCAWIDGSISDEQFYTLAEMVPVE